MSRLIKRTLPLAIVCLFLSQAACTLDRQAAAEDAINLMQLNGEKLLSDLEFVVKLATEKEQQQWQNIKETFDIFAFGVDLHKPLRIDLLLDSNGIRYRSCFPFANIDDFHENLDGFGMAMKPLAKDFYQIDDGAGFTGFMREKDGYVVIAEKQTDIPPNLADPRLSISTLVEKAYDAAAQIKNSAETKDARRKSMQHIRKEALAAVKKRTGEAPARFALRKTLAEQQLGEAERFFVESSQIDVGWYTDTQKKQGRMEIQLAAFPDTDLAASIKQLSQKPSRFAGVPRAEKSILSARVNHPLDEMRTQNFLELFKQLKNVAVARIDESQKLDASQKEKAKQAADVFFEMLIAGTNMGVVDGYIEVAEPKPGQRTLTAGIHSPDGSPIKKIVELLPGIKQGFEVELKHKTQGDVEIHRVTAPADLLPELHEFFGGQSTGYVASGPDTVWLAAGPDALEALTSAIQKAAEPGDGTADPRFVDLSVTLGPWAELLDKRLSKETPSNVDQEGEPQPKWRSREEQALFRTMAIEAFALGQDTMTFTLKRVEDHVEGSGQFDEGVLRFAGKMICWFSKENL